MPPSPRVSIVMVTFNSASDVAEALESALASAAEAGLTAEIVVVDNASTDGSVDVVRSRFREARVLINAANLGFGVASNRAFAVAHGTYLVLINPDARLELPALGVLRRFLVDHPRAGAAAPTIRAVDVRGVESGGAESAGMLPGLQAALGHFLFLNRLVPRQRQGPWQGFAIRSVRGADPQRVEWASAAALMLRASAVREVGGFDPAIFLYGEDTDLCARLARAGWEIWLVPKASARHAIAASQGGISGRWVDGLHDFYAGRSSRPRLVAFDTIMAVGLGIRGVAAAATREGRHRRRMFVAARRAAILAGRTLARGH